MKSELIGKGFNELSVDEAERISGGSIFSAILDGIANTVTELTGSHTPVSNLAYLGLGIVEWVVRPFYQFFGLRFR
jgi:hypothetical protein